MRHYLFAIPLAVLAAPAVAAPPPPPDQIRIPPELRDPALGRKLSAVSQAVSKALLDLPVGEVQAAAEGRPVTPADRNRTIGDIARRSNPDIDRQIAQSGPAIDSAIHSFTTALPAITDALSRAASEIERVTANLPDPNYPRR